MNLTLSTEKHGTDLQKLAATEGYLKKLFHRGDVGGIRYYEPVLSRKVQKGTSYEERPVKNYMAREPGVNEPVRRERKQPAGSFLGRIFKAIGAD